MIARFYIEVSNMEKHLSEVVSRLNTDMHRLSGESKEFLSFVKKHLFNKVPSMSALAGVAVGAYVSSVFTSSPVRGVMTSIGILGRDADVASPLALWLLSIFLPLFAAATTVYLVQKWLKSFRQKQIARYREMTARLDKPKQEELALKLELLEKAKEAGLITGSEYEAKLAGLYQGYTKTLLPPGVEEFILKKLTS